MKTFEEIAERLWLIRAGNIFKYSDEYFFTITSIEGETVYCKSISGQPTHRDFTAKKEYFEYMVSIGEFVKI